MNDTDLVVRSGDDARVTYLQDVRAQTHHAPRIKQHLDAEAADRLLALCGARSTSAFATVALDCEGRYWSLEPIPETCPVEAERGRLIWRRLWVPPLPDAEGSDD